MFDLFQVENLSSYSKKDSRFTLLYVENALKMLKELYVEKGIVVRNLPSNSKKDCVQKKVCRKFRKISKRIVLELALKTLKGLYIEKGMQKIIVCRNLQGLYVEKF